VVRCPPTEQPSLGKQAPDVTGQFAKPFLAVATELEVSVVDVTQITVRQSKAAAGYLFGFRHSSLVSSHGRPWDRDFVKVLAGDLRTSRLLASASK